MLRIDAKNVNFNGVCMIEDTQVASMSANSNDNNLYFSIAIENLATYKENQLIVDADIEAFKEAVLEAM